MKKSVLSFILVLFMLSLMIVPAAAASYPNSYTGSYSMTGGIFYKKSFSSGTEMEITVTPITGTSDCNMGIYTATNSSVFGWQGADFINSVSSVMPSASEYTTAKDIDGIYFRNWSGNRWTGNFTVRW